MGFWRRPPGVVLPWVCQGTRSVLGRHFALSMDVRVAMPADRLREGDARKMCLGGSVRRRFPAPLPEKIFRRDHSAEAHRPDHRSDIHWITALVGCRCFDLIDDRPSDDGRFFYPRFYIRAKITVMAFSPFVGWITAYLLPVVLVFGVIGVFSRRSGTVFRMLVVHGGLCLSIIMSQYLLYSSGRSFPWNFYLPSALSFVIVIVIVSVLLGRFGFLYAFSAFIQQLTLASIAYDLSGTLNFWLIAILVVPIYAASHLLQIKHWHIKIPATLAWGVLSLALFALRGDILLNASLHAILGSALIYFGILYPRSDFAIKRA